MKPVIFQCIMRSMYPHRLKSAVGAWGAAAGCAGDVGREEGCAPTTLFDIDNKSEAMQTTAVTTKTEVTTTTWRTPESTPFLVDKPRTIPSDGVERQIPLAVIPLEATFAYVVAPRSDRTVYIKVS